MSEETKNSKNFVEIQGRVASFCWSQRFLQTLHKLHGGNDLETLDEFLYIYFEYSRSLLKSLINFLFTCFSQIT